MQALAQKRPMPTMPRRDRFTSPWEGPRITTPLPIPLGPFPEQEEDQSKPVPVPVPGLRDDDHPVPTLITQLPLGPKPLAPGEVRESKPAETCYQAARDFANGCRQLANVRALMPEIEKFIEKQPYEEGKSELLETRFDGLLEVEKMLLDRLNELALKLEECGCSYSQASCTVRCPDGRFFSPQEGKDLIEFEFPDFPMPTFREMFPPGPSWWERGLAGISKLGRKKMHNLAQLNSAMAARHQSPFVPGHAVAKPALGQDETPIEMDTAMYIMAGSWTLFGGLGAYYAFDAETTFGYISGAGLAALSVFGLMGLFSVATT